MSTNEIPAKPKGNSNREAVSSLSGYIYQIYQSAYAWLQLDHEEFLFLEVAEDYVTVAQNALNAVQVKETKHRVTINSDDIIASIESFVELQEQNPNLQVYLRHLTTSIITKEKSPKDRIGDTPSLDMWQKLKKSGDTQPFKQILLASKVSDTVKEYIKKLDDSEFREKLLKKMSFDCGAPDSNFLLRLIRSRLSKLIEEKGGYGKQVDQCLDRIIFYILNKAAQQGSRVLDKHDLDKIIDEYAKIQVSRAQFDRQGELINQALQANSDGSLPVATSKLLSSINDTPFPKAITYRENYKDDIQNILNLHGMVWLSGTSGIGKTFLARLVAHSVVGKWAGINLRGMKLEQVVDVLSRAASSIEELDISGLIIDDLECVWDFSATNALLYLKAACDYQDLLLIVTSTRNISPDFLHSANVPSSIQKKIEGFSENDISDLLKSINVDSEMWSRYLHLSSGAGHPQLVAALIQYMSSQNWDKNELVTLDSLLKGNDLTDQVKLQTRQKLFQSMPEKHRSFLERISLKVGKFTRDLALDIGKLEPILDNVGFTLDDLVGSWVDQHEKDKFSLSPLLSNLADSTLTSTDKKNFSYQIADLLLKDNIIEPTETDSILCAAWAGENDFVIFQICTAILRCTQDELELIAPHASMLSLASTDIPIYEKSPEINQVCRGVQLLLNCYKEYGLDRYDEILQSFRVEGKQVNNNESRLLMDYTIYAKLLLSDIKFGAIPNFWQLIVGMKSIEKQLSQYIPEESVPVSILFFNQVRQIRSTSDLLALFKFLDDCEEEFRNELLDQPKRQEYDADMLVANAWVNQKDAIGINPIADAEIYRQLEVISQNWKQVDIAISCRKYRAVIIDECGEDKNHAISIIDEGLNVYGETSSELVRAKAKILYRAQDYSESLELSSRLIESDISLNNIEKSYLGREAAVSAEHKGDFATARKYYLYGSLAAQDCEGQDMLAMKVGLMADAALASWYEGDQAECLRDFVEVINILQTELDPQASLRCAHRHAILRHALLWLKSSSLNEEVLLEGDDEILMYPGIISNPSPNPDIKSLPTIPIEMAWYMLATIENNCCIDVGATDRLYENLPNGPIYSGQFLLSDAQLRKSLALLDCELFVESLKEHLRSISYCMEGNRLMSSSGQVKYGSFPKLTAQQEIDRATNIQHYLICFFLKCFFDDCMNRIDQLVSLIKEKRDSEVGLGFLISLEQEDNLEDYNTNLARQIYVYKALSERRGDLTPQQAFEVVFKAIDVSNKSSTMEVILESAIFWLKKRVKHISANQKFLLKFPRLYNNQAIVEYLNDTNQPCKNRLCNALVAILPALGFSNEPQLKNRLEKIAKSK